MKESYSLSVAAFYALRAGSIKMNAKKQQVSCIQALKIIVENLDSVAQRSLCSSIGFRPCVVCLGILTSPSQSIWFCAALLNHVAS